jgi:predicted CxxxxCH...CXXCH cytochrome family protein
MHFRTRVSAALILLGFGALACGDSRSVTTSRLGGTCTQCHGGGDNQTGAPPLDLQGRSDTSLPSVGAHTAHLQAGALSGGVDCSECHVKPTAVDSPGHLDGRVTITWGARATANGTLAPQYDANAHSCSSVYCHGSFTGGNASNAPVWTEGPAQAACGTCHGNPNATPTSLPAGHAHLGQLADDCTSTTCQVCNVCHAQTVSPDGTVDVAGGMHVNGQVEVDPAAIHPSGWLDSSSPDFHGGSPPPPPNSTPHAVPASYQDCLRCHTVNPPAQVTTVVCNGCHALISDPFN